MPSDLRSALNHAVLDELDAALQRIVHCVNQLSDEQVWSRERADMNSIANLMLHLAGNVGQLIVSGIGGAPDNRDRPAEFAARDTLSKAELIQRLTETVNQAKAAVIAANDEVLCQKIPIQRYDWTGMQAVVRCLAHFRGHAQEIIHMTRIILVEQYEFAGQR